MVRWLCILGVGVLAGVHPATFGAEPTRSLPVVLVQGGDAAEWLTCLGHECVRIEPLLFDQAERDESKTSKPLCLEMLSVHAVVVCNEPDGLTTRFWTERLRNQGPLEILALPAPHTVHRWEHERRALKQIHQLLVRLSPESQATLDHRLQMELIRRQSNVAAAIPLVGR